MSEKEHTMQPHPVATPPGGTVDPENAVAVLVRDYRTFAKKSAENVLGLAATILKADGLGGADRRCFYTEVRLDEKGSTARKLRVIGNQLPRFQPYLDKLPGTWTTLYELAKLKQEEFEKVVESGVLGPVAKMTEIDDVLGRAKEKFERQFKVFIDLGTIGVRSQKVEFVRELKQPVDQYGLKLESPNHEDELSELIDEPVGHNQAA